MASKKSAFNRISIHNRRQVIRDNCLSVCISACLISSISVCLSWTWNLSFSVLALSFLVLSCLGVVLSYPILSYPILSYPILRSYPIPSYPVLFSQPTCILNSFIILQNKLSGENTKVLDKYPSFQLVLDFVTNSDFSHSRYFHVSKENLQIVSSQSINKVFFRYRVEDLLQERTKFAHDVSEIYFFAAEYVRMFSKPHIFQVHI